MDRQSVPEDDQRIGKLFDFVASDKPAAKRPILFVRALAKIQTQLPGRAVIPSQRPKGRVAAPIVRQPSEPARCAKLRKQKLEHRGSDGKIAEIVEVSVAPKTVLPALVVAGQERQQSSIIGKREGAGFVERKPGRLQFSPRAVLLQNALPKGDARPTPAQRSRHIQQIPDLSRLAPGRSRLRLGTSRPFFLRRIRELVQMLFPVREAHASGKRGAVSLAVACSRGRPARGPAAARGVPVFVMRVVPESVTDLSVVITFNHVNGERIRTGNPQPEFSSVSGKDRGGNMFAGAPLGKTGTRAIDAEAIVIRLRPIQTNVVGKLLAALHESLETVRADSHDGDGTVPKIVFAPLPVTTVKLGRTTPGQIHKPRGNVIQATGGAHTFPQRRYGPRACRVQNPLTPIVKPTRGGRDLKTRTRRPTAAGRSWHGQTTTVNALVGADCGTLSPVAYWRRLSFPVPRGGPGRCRTASGRGRFGCGCQC